MIRMSLVAHSALVCLMSVLYARTAGRRGWATNQNLRLQGRPTLQPQSDPSAPPGRALIIEGRRKQSDWIFESLLRYYKP